MSSDFMLAGLFWSLPLSQSHPNLGDSKADGAYLTTMYRCDKDKLVHR